VNRHETPCDKCGVSLGWHGERCDADPDPLTALLADLAAEIERLDALAAGQRDEGHVTASARILGHADANRTEALALRAILAKHGGAR
jgi:hypothetical protein